MKVKTLIGTMLYKNIDEVELYDKNENLISKMCLETLLDSYGDYRVKQFHIYTEPGEGIVTLELILHGKYIY